MFSILYLDCAESHTFQSWDLDGNDDVCSGEPIRQEEGDSSVERIFQRFQSRWVSQLHKVVEEDHARLPQFLHILIRLHPLGHFITSLAPEQGP